MSLCAFWLLSKKISVEPGEFHCQIIRFFACSKYPFELTIIRYLPLHQIALKYIRDQVSQFLRKEYVLTSLKQPFCRHLRECLLFCQSMYNNLRRFIFRILENLDYRAFQDTY
jgi:hypothetical protein